MTTLLPAVDLFQQEFKRQVEVRSSEFHDRFLFVDRAECYISGASFKDGAKTSALAKIDPGLLAKSGPR